MVRKGASLATPIAVPLPNTGGVSDPVDCINTIGIARGKSGNVFIY